MATSYKFTAVSPDGSKSSGVIEAENENIVKDIIDSRGLIPISVRRRDDGLGGIKKIFSKSIGNESLVFLTRKLLTLSRAGIPIIRSLDIIIEDTIDEKMNRVLKQIRKSIEGGSSLAEALESHDGYFPLIYIETIKAGEESGTLDVMLARIMNLLEREAKIKEGIKTAVRYPSYVLITMAAAFFVIITLVVPKFSGLYSANSAELPWATRLLIDINIFVRSYWPLLIGVAPLLAYSIWRLRLTNWGKKTYDSISLSLPIISPIFVKAAMARFCYMMSVLLAAGIPLARALIIISKAIGNHYFSKVLADVGENLSGGHDLVQPMRESKYFSPLVVQMISLGLESGSLESLLQETARHFDAEIDFDTRKLTSRIEPILTFVIAGMVLILALAVLTPMWNLLEVFKR